MNAVQLLFGLAFIVFTATFFRILADVKNELNVEHDSARWSSGLATGFIGITWFLEIYNLHYQQHGWSLRLIMNLVQLPILLVAGIAIAA